MPLVENQEETFYVLLFIINTEYNFTSLYTRGNRMILVKQNLMQRDSLFHSFKMHLLLQSKHSHNQQGKEDNMRELRVEINRCLFIVSK